METNAIQKPDPSRVWREQFLVVGLALRMEALLAAGALGILCLATVIVARVPGLSVVVDGSAASLRMDPAEPPWSIAGVLIALVLPILAWRGESPFGATPLWSLPVDHRRHTLVRVTVGWAWLMMLLGTALLAIAATVLLAGGHLGVDELRTVIVDRAGMRAGLGDATRQLSYTTPWWEWLRPFTSSTAAYLLVSALWIGTPYPLRWAALIWVSVGMLVGISHWLGVEWAIRETERFSWLLGGDPYTAPARLPDGSGVEGWLQIPSTGMWLVSTGFWTVLGLVSLLVASARPRDH